MDFAADVLLAAGAIGCAVYCLVLSRRLERFRTLENGMGGAIAVLSAQVDDMTRALEAAKGAAAASEATLTALNDRSEHAARRLELLLASLHDLPGAADGASGAAMMRARVVRRRRGDRAVADALPVHQDEVPA